MQFSSLLQATVVAAMASSVMASSLTPICPPCDDTNSSCGLLNPTFVKAVKITPARKGWTSTFNDKIDKVSVSMSKGQPSILLANEEGKDAVVRLTYQRYDNKQVPMYLAPHGQECLIPEHVGDFSTDEVVDVQIYVKSA